MMLMTTSNIDKFFRKLFVFYMVLLISCTFTISPAYGRESEIFTDANGKQIPISRPFTRIISLYSAHTENLCSLGANEHIIGISQSDDYPEDILDKPRFSYREDAEKFIGHKPDLVLVRPMIERSYPQFIKKLRRAHITVISLQPNSVDDLFDYWRTLAMLTGKKQEVENMISAFNKRLSDVRQSLDILVDHKRPKVYFQSIHSKSKTFAPESIAVFALKQAGGINIGADARQVRKTNIAFYGKEQILAKGAEIEIFLAQRGRMNPITKETILKEPGYKAIKAVREGKVFLIEESLVSRPTLRIAEGIEKLFAIFYPETSTTSALQ